MFIHLTDFCNQNCPFCFAREEMTKSVQKKLELEDYKKIALKAKRFGAKFLQLLGGEPTLHPQFGEILAFTMRHFILVKIFTNGIFPIKVIEAIEKYAPRVNLVFNLSTPGFTFQPKIRELVLNNIDRLADNNIVTLSVIDAFQTPAIIKNSLSLIPPELIKKTLMKLNFISPQAGDVNMLKIEDFPNVGANIVKIVRYLKKVGPPRQIRINKMFRPCMFSKSQRAFLDKEKLNFIYQNTTCHFEDIKKEGFHITSDKITFKCYPLSTVDLLNHDIKSMDMKKTYDYYQQKQHDYGHNYILPYCRQCPFFGLESGQCSGPCMAFRINALSAHGHK